MTTLASITCAGDGEIRTFTLDGDELTPLGSSHIGDGVSTLAPDATGLRGWSGTKQPTGVATLQLDPASGVWQVQARTATDDSITYLQVSECQRFLLGASYGGGYGLVWPIVDGTLGEPTARVEFANLHCVIEFDRFVYFVSLGEDLIACYRLTDDGGLEPLEVPTVAAPAGSGPRHLVASPDRRTLYCVTEFSGEVVRFSRATATGVLTREQVVAAFAPDRGLQHSRIGADPVEEHLIWGADLHLAGGWLVVSERCESTLTALPVAPDGSLGEPTGFVETEQQPRGFAVTTDGHHVICPGEKTSQVSLFRLDDGQLTRLARVPSGQGGNWVRLLER